MLNDVRTYEKYPYTLVYKMTKNDRFVESYRKEQDYEDHDRLWCGDQTLQSYTEG